MKTTDGGTSAYPSTYGIYKTTDKGNTWQPDTSNYYSAVSKIFFADTDIGYALALISRGTALMKMIFRKHYFKLHKEIRMDTSIDFFDQE